ncbi:hypothetical protein ACFE04_013597 [Oxalis oulophora]
MKPLTNKPSDRSDSKYRGVRKRKWGKYVSEIRLPNCRQRIWLGSFDSPEKAALAFDAALFCLRGPSAKFNFPESPPVIDGGRNMSSAEIQAAATEYANSKSETRTESASPSQSLCTPTASSASEFELEVDNNNSCFMDLLTCTGSGNFATEYELFPNFDDLTNDYFTPSVSNSVEFDEENYFDGVSSQGSYLWSF